MFCYSKRVELEKSLSVHVSLPGDYTKVKINLSAVVSLGTSDDFSLRFFSKPGESTELQNQELIENS